MVGDLFKSPTLDNAAKDMRGLKTAIEYGCKFAMYPMFLFFSRFYQLFII